MAGRSSAWRGRLSIAELCFLRRRVYRTLHGPPTPPPGAMPAAAYAPGMSIRGFPFSILRSGWNVARIAL